MKLADRQICTGCAACLSLCANSSIEMKENHEGFLYPDINEKECTQCNLCKKNCPAIMQIVPKKPLNVYAAKNHDEKIRYQSSSGGIFTLLAENTIKESGVVFGARFNEKWEVIHDYTETTEGLAAFRGSKYVQSVTGETYKQAKIFLEKGRGVLYSGVPCQIVGLKAFLGKDYDNLLTVDLVCSAVSSPLVWKKYINEIIEKVVNPSSLINGLDAILGINFRNKVSGWKNSIISISISPDSVYAHIQNTNRVDGCTISRTSVNEPYSLITTYNENIYMKGGFRKLYSRLSCYNCFSKPFKSDSDITIGDYWGIEKLLPEFDDDTGISLVMVNTEKGKKIYGCLNKIDIETTSMPNLFGSVRNYNYIHGSATMPKERKYFFSRWKNESIISLVHKLTKDSLLIQIKKLIIILLRRLGLLVFVKLFLRKRI